MARVAQAHADYAVPAAQRIAALKLARAAADGAPGEPALQLVLARCALFVASPLEDRSLQAAVAEEGYRAAGLAGADNREGCYYRAVHLGMMIRHKGLIAVGRLPEMETLLKSACREPATDAGGPLRVLGMLYLRAPPWPKGIGDLERALECLEQAAAQFPGHPANHLFTAYALREDDEPEAALGALQKASAALEQGEWGDFGAEWRREIDALRAALKPAR